MSEPTPLSAEELADGDDFDTCSFGLDHDAIDRALAEQDATIDAQATEIAALKGALDRVHRDRIGQSNGYSCGCWWDTQDDEAPAGVTLVTRRTVGWRGCWPGRRLRVTDLIARLARRPA